MGLATIDPHIIKCTPSFTKSPGLVYIDLKVSKIQPFDNVKIYKEMYGHPDTVRHSVRMLYVSLLILTFSNRCISVKTSLINTKLGDFVILGRSIENEDPENEDPKT